ncbi:hypothetical protein CHUAL_010467 [Chamberlinius hualienensis]
MGEVTRKPSRINWIDRKRNSGQRTMNILICLSRTTSSTVITVGILDGPNDGCLYYNKVYTAAMLHSTVQVVASAYNSNDVINHPLQQELKQEPYYIVPTAAATVPELCSNRPIRAISIFNFTFDAHRFRSNMVNGFSSIDMVGRHIAIVPITVGDKELQQRFVIFPSGDIDAD